LWFDDQPLLLFSLRYDRHDVFWHALFHELDHVAHDEGRDEPIIDQDMMGKCSAGIEIEQRANAAAANLLIPQTELTRFMTRAGPYVPGHLIIEFAEKLAIHPGIVVGQLQHHGIIAWSSMNSFKSRVREFLVPHAMSDGFGRVSR
jgi:HTH-type transcriptional regulator/antitoxin HigA